MTVMWDEKLQDILFRNNFNIQYNLSFLFQMYYIIKNIPSIFIIKNPY